MVHIIYSTNYPICGERLGGKDNIENYQSSLNDVYTLGSVLQQCFRVRGVLVKFCRHFSTTGENGANPAGSVYYRR